MIVEVKLTLCDAHELFTLMRAVEAIEGHRRALAPGLVSVEEPTPPVFLDPRASVPGVATASALPASANLVTVAMLETELRGFLSRNAGDIAKARALLDKYNLERISGADTLTDDQRVRLRAELSA